MPGVLVGGDGEGLCRSRKRRPLTYPTALVSLDANQPNIDEPAGCEGEKGKPVIADT